MSTTSEFRKANALLQSFHRNLPETDIEEHFVDDYHGILRVLEQQTGDSFGEFFVPTGRMDRQVSSYVSPNRFNQFKGTTRYTDSRYCDRDYFLMRLEAAIMFLDSRVPKEAIGPVEIKLAILKAIKDKYNGEYKYNLLPSAELGRRGPVENYLGVTFDDDLRRLAGACFDQLREADLIRSTHSTNRDPENWVRLTEAGLQAHGLGKIDDPSETSTAAESQIHIKFGVLIEAVFDEHLRSTVEQVELVSVLFLDLDNFKSVNDNYDHEAGDQVIREAIVLIQTAIRGKGELFHRSGDEMLVLLPNFDDTEAISLGERIRKAIKDFTFSTIGSGVVTATIGASTYPTSCTRWEELKVTADRVAMRAKKCGKDLVAHSGVLEQTVGSAP